jgi:hypothetical protein
MSCQRLYDSGARQTVWYDPSVTSSGSSLENEPMYVPVHDYEDLAEEPFEGDELCTEEETCLFPERCVCSTETRELIAFLKAGSPPDDYQTPE